MTSDRVTCDLCPRECRLSEGQRGYCYVRMNRGGQIMLDTYGRTSGFGLDPIEKKPLNHFLPGSLALSFGTAGCNLGCKFCQNWEISTSRRQDTLSQTASPDQIARAALNKNAASVAMTYNDPVIFYEFAADVSAACRTLGVHPVAVTAGYISPKYARSFFSLVDAANIDLKSFSDDFYRTITGGRLNTVLNSIATAVELGIHVELTTLIIPGYNDSDSEISAMCQWVVENVGPDVPHHFSAFHPDNRMRDVPRTPPQTLARAYDIAREAGEHFPYTGNVHDARGDTTFCPSCNQRLIVRDWYRILENHLTSSGTCPNCGTTIAGVF